MHIVCALLLSYVKFKVFYVVSIAIYVACLSVRFFIESTEQSDRQIFVRKMCVEMKRERGIEREQVQHLQLCLNNWRLKTAEADNIQPVSTYLFNNKLLSLLPFLRKNKVSFNFGFLVWLFYYIQRAKDGKRYKALFLVQMMNKTKRKRKKTHREEREREANGNMLM